MLKRKKIQADYDKKFGIKFSNNNSASRGLQCRGIDRILRIFATVKLICPPLRNRRENRAQINALISNFAKKICPIPLSRHI